MSPYAGPFKVDRPFEHVLICLFAGGLGLAMNRCSCVWVISFLGRRRSHADGNQARVGQDGSALIHVATQRPNISGRDFAQSIWGGDEN